jgi:hypothetical protein
LLSCYVLWVFVHKYVYIVLISSDFECSWWLFFQKRFVCTKLDIYVYMTSFYVHANKEKQPMFLTDQYSRIEMNVHYSMNRTDVYTVQLSNMFQNQRKLLSETDIYFRNVSCFKQWQIIVLSKSVSMTILVNIICIRKVCLIF